MILAIAGNKYSGKDTLADVVENHFSFKRYAFADPLKAATEVIFAFSEEDKKLGKDEILPFWNISKRVLWQWIGSELFQFKLMECSDWKFERKVWVKRFEKLLTDEVFDVNEHWVLPGTRFNHEIEGLKEIANKFNMNPVVTVQVLREGFEGDNHVSEKENSNLIPDHLLLNYSSLQEFIVSCELFCNTVLNSYLAGGQVC
jgi:hypothetical protein